MSISISSNNVDVGKDVKIWCLRKDPQQDIRVEQWKFGGRSIDEYPRFSERTVTTFNKLYIKSAQISDSGNYTCVTLLGQQTETLRVSGNVKSNHSRCVCFCVVVVVVLMHVFLLAFLPACLLAC